MHKIAGHLGPNAGRIEYEGMSSYSDSSIRINPEWVLGEYPLPPEKVDVVIGHVVHEALHHIEWSTRVWKTLEPDMENMSPLEQVMFQQVVFTAEDIYIDQKSEQSVFGLYTAILRGKKMTAASHVNAPSLDHLLLNWANRRFDDSAFQRAKSEYKTLPVELADLAGKLSALTGSAMRVLEKCKKRAMLYLDAWHRVGSMVRELPVHKKQLYWYRARHVSDRGKALLPSTGAETGGKLTPRLARDVQTCLAADGVDITPLIRSVAGFDNETIAPMSRWDFNMPTRPVVDKQMIGRLKMIFRNYASSRKLVSRGVSSGKIDPGRLYRAPVNGRCFKEELWIRSPDWCIAILIDASGSMCGSKWKMVESIVANLHRAICGEKNRLDAWAYFESGGICP
jgi:hypothetical protein